MRRSVGMSKYSGSDHSTRNRQSSINTRLKDMESDTNIKMSGVCYKIKETYQTMMDTLLKRYTHKTSHTKVTQKPNNSCLSTVMTNKPGITPHSIASLHSIAEVIMMKVFPKTKLMLQCQTSGVRLSP